MVACQLSALNGTFPPVRRSADDRIEASSLARSGRKRIVRFRVAEVPFLAFVQSDGEWLNSTQCGHWN
jgi:hypothetical protein